MDSDTTPLRVLLTGGSGLIGSSLRLRLRQCGITVTELSRHPAPGDFMWDAATGEPPPAEALRGIDAVVHLAGTPIAARWTANTRRSIRASRVNGTRALAEALAALPHGARPAAFVCMSGAGIYGLKRTELHLGEKATIAPQGESFLAEVAAEWEQACAPAIAAGIRTVNLRTGMVLSARGGALAKLIRPYRAFLGGPAGPGTQRMPWISLDDLTSLIFFCLRTPTISGPVNAVAPHAVTNADFAKKLGVALHRPALLRTPAWVLRLALGRMADELILCDLSPFPAKAMEAGFQFNHPRIDDALGDIFGPASTRSV